MLDFRCKLIEKLGAKIKLSPKGLTKRISEALQIEHLRPNQTQAFREALDADKEGETADGTYNFPSVPGMMQYLKSHSKPETIFAMGYFARFSQNPIRSHEETLKELDSILNA